MQDNIIKAFRQRLIRHGYYDISIYDNFNGTYSLWFKDSNHQTVSYVLTLEQMANIPRLVWFD